MVRVLSQNGLESRMNPEIPEKQAGAAPSIMTVSELNRAVGRLLEISFPLLWVQGEISNFTRAASGHWYFSLKDREAQVRCVMFRGRNQALDWVPREGDHVEARAVVGLYAARGEFQLGVEQLRRAGAGSLYEAFLRVKAKLEAEGLFDAGRKRPIPVFARTLGVVTSLQAAALRDVLSTIRRRAPHVRVIIYPAPVQGRDAGAKLAEAVHRAGVRAECDVLLLVRGGGSIEDLWAFNDETLARTIVACPVPVVSGVGHETDFTIADFAADLRAPTPTAAAELAAPDRGSWQVRVDRQRAQLARLMKRRLSDSVQDLDYLQRRLKSPLQRWRESRARVVELARRLVAGTASRQASASERLRYLQSALARARPAIDARRAQVLELSRRLTERSARRLSASARALELAQARLVLLDPQAALLRGYAIVTDQSGGVVREAGQLSPGQAVGLRLAKGSAQARIERIESAAVTGPSKS